MADNNSSDLDIGGEMEKQFPPTITSPNQPYQSPRSGQTKSVTTVTEQIRTLAQTISAINRELDALEKNFNAAIADLRKMVGKI